jgi:hypothetical protein
LVDSRKTFAPSGTVFCSRRFRSIPAFLHVSVAKASELGIFGVPGKDRAVAQLGSALEWGSRGRGFESRRPDIKEFNRLLIKHLAINQGGRAKSVQVTDAQEGLVTGPRLSSKVQRDRFSVAPILERH